jgi:xanthine dehydrogenase YagR molybdenum-binding subunit
VHDVAEELAYGGYRPGAQIDLAVLGSEDGDLRAVTAAAYMDSGDSAGQTVAGTMRFSYPDPPMSLVDYDVVSNGAPAKPFHAPGAPIALFALETAIDELAERSGRDPIEMRRGWEPRSGRTALYEWAASHPLWLNRSDADRNGATLRGVGVAFGTWHYAYDPATKVRVRTTDTGLVVETGTQEIGTGTTHSLAVAVAEEFGLTSGDIRVRIGDSNLGHGPTSSASRTTPALVPTARAAAAELRVGLVEFANQNLGLDGAIAVQGGIDHAGEFVPWADLWPRLQGRSTTKKRPREQHIPVTPIAVAGAKLGWGITDAAHIVALDIDRASGEVKVTDAAAGLAAGPIHTPQQATSGVHGAFARGLGEALFEARITDPATGIVTTDSYADYRLLRMSEMPNIEVTFLEDTYDYTPAGESGIAELAITSIPAAVANAVADATGWRPRRMPITPDDVVAGLRNA